jgi:hypothetical protein
MNDIDDTLTPGATALPSTPQDGRNRLAEATRWRWSGLAYPRDLFRRRPVQAVLSAAGVTAAAASLLAVLRARRKQLPPTLRQRLADLYRRVMQKL